MLNCVLLRQVLAAALTGALGLGTAYAADSDRKPAVAAASAPVVSDREAREWLSRIRQAPAKRSFQGTFVVSTGGALSSARLSHYLARGSQFEMVESLDGQARQVLRHDDLIQTVWPQARVAVIEERDKIAVFPALLRDSDSRLIEFYELRVLGTDRVAGRTADVLSMTPRDGWRFGNRLWSDRETGLLLRADVLNADGQLLESSAFSEVTIGVRARPEAVLDAMSQARRLSGDQTDAHPDRARSRRLGAARAGTWIPARQLHPASAARHRRQRRRGGRAAGPADRLHRRADPCIDLHRAVHCAASSETGADEHRCDAHPDAAPVATGGSPSSAMCRRRL